MRVLVFGASSTQGYWDSQGGWADRLKHYYDELQMKDFSVELPHVMNLGVSGDTTKEILKRINDEIKARENEKGISVIIQVGSNNAAEIDGKTRSSTKDYQKELEELIKKAEEHTYKVLVVGLPAVDEAKTNPITWADMYFKNENIKMFEKAAGETAEAMEIAFVPIHGEFLKRMEEGESLQAHDGLHPNDEGHQMIFELVRPKLDELLAA
jgi:lysophospholipase L1-like esterase